MKLVNVKLHIFVGMPLLHLKIIDFIGLVNSEWHNQVVNIGIFVMGTDCYKVEFSAIEKFYIKFWSTI